MNDIHTLIYELAAWCYTYSSLTSFSFLLRNSVNTTLLFGLAWYWTAWCSCWTPRWFHSVGARGSQQSKCKCSPRPTSSTMRARLWIQVTSSEASLPELQPQCTTQNDMIPQQWEPFHNFIDSVLMLASLILLPMNFPIWLVFACEYFEINAGITDVQHNSRVGVSDLIVIT